MNETLLLQLMNSLIFQNGDRLISGTVLNQVLDQMIQFAQVNELDAPFVPNNAAIVAGDSIFSALEKTQGQINMIGGGPISVNRDSYIWVDIVFGNDGTGLREDFTKPFATVDAAITASVSGDTIILGKGSHVTSTNMFVNGLNYLIDKGTTLIVGVGATASFSGVSHSIIGEGILQLNAGVLCNLAFDGTLKIDVDRIELASGVAIEMDTAPIVATAVIGVLDITANYVGFNQYMVIQNGNSQIRFKSKRINNNGGFAAFAAFVFDGDSFTGTQKRQHFIEIEEAFVITDNYGFVVISNGDIKEEFFINANGALFNGGVGVGLLAGVICGSTGALGYVRLHGNWRMTDCAYVTNQDASPRFHVSGLVKHNTTAGSQRAVSICNTAKLILDSTIISDSASPIVEQNNPIWGTQSVGACTVEVRGQLRNLNAGASGRGILVETNTGVLRLSKDCRIQLGIAANNAIHTTGALINVAVYSCFTNGAIHAQIVNSISGTTVIADNDIAVTDLT